jgi:hypothetical protein
MSPMLYHRRMGRSTGWVGESVEWLSRTVNLSAGKPPLIWPIVEAYNDPGDASAAEFREALTQGRSGGATGVMMFTIGAVAKDPAQMRVLKELYSR